MVKQKKISISIFSIVFIGMFLITQLTACYKEDNTDDINQIQEIELTKENFFDYYIPNTESTFIRTYKEVLGRFRYEYKVDYSIKCKYTNAISNDVKISFKVDTESYYDYENNETKFRYVNKTMYLTDAGNGNVSYTYDSFFDDGGYVLTKGNLSKVIGTIKIPKNSY